MVTTNPLTRNAGAGFGALHAVNESEDSTDLEGMSLESLVMAVLSERHTVSENMVMDQIKQMQEKNKELKKLGDLTAEVTARMKEFGNDPKSGTVINKYDERGNLNKPILPDEVKQKPWIMEAILKGDKFVGEGNWTQRREALMDSSKVPGDCNKPGEWYTNARKYVNEQTDWKPETRERVLKDLDLAETAASYGINTGTNGDPIGFAVNNNNYGSLEALQAKIKSQTDALTNDTQLDQIRLQSLMSKVQNLAQLLSTMVKKFDDTQASLVQKT